MFAVFTALAAMKPSPVSPPSAPSLPSQEGSNPFPAMYHDLTGCADLVASSFVPTQ